MKLERLNTQLEIRATKLQKAIFIVCSISIIVTAGCSKKNNEDLKVFDYIQADGYVDTIGRPVVKWLTNEKVIYGTNSNGRKDSFEGYLKRSSTGDDYDFETTKQVNIFDVSTQKTTLYKKGRLLNYEDGEITILLSINVKEFGHDSEENESIYLFGKFGSEDKVSYNNLDNKPFVNYHTVDKKCPTDDFHYSSGDYSTYLLKPEHGCLRLPSLHGKDRWWTYFRSNGEATKLTQSKVLLIPEIYWIDWLEAYVLGNKFTFRHSNNIPVLFPSGEFYLVQLEHQVFHAKPTRAGFVGAINQNITKEVLSGLYLFKNNEKLRMSSSVVISTEVSPDGCKLAFVTKNQKLRVINVCSSYGSNFDLSSMVN